MTASGQQTILIVGLGLIGGSIARALRKREPVWRILAVDTNTGSLARAESEGIIDASGELGDCVGQADLIVLAVPPLQIVRTINEIAPYLREDSVITDVGSVKSHIMEALETQSETLRRNFVPGHPIAGSERSGFAAATDDLFRDRNVIITPGPDTSAEAVMQVHRFWQHLGARVLGMSIQQHDEVLAATSHLPHLLAFGIVDTLLAQTQSEEIFRYAAGGFADFSRLASSNPRMWTDIFLSNAGPTCDALDAYITKLQEMKSLLEAGDEQGMMAIFERARRTRDNFIARHFNTEQLAEEMQEEATSFHIEPGGTVEGDIRVPGDKSISHRAVIFASIANGKTEISGFLEGEDALNTVAAFREMGVTIVGPEAGSMTVYGVGLNGLQAPRVPLYLGNSGTSMRLLAGLLAAQTFSSELTGDESLSRRPMQRVSDPLRQMGAQIESDPDGTPPLRITGAKLKGISYPMKIASAQVKSCLLLAGLYAEGETEVIEPAPTRDHTERMLAGFGYPLQRDPAAGRVSLKGGGELTATRIDIPSDISSAAFFLVAASICPGADLTLRHVGINPTRTGVINLLRSMGAYIELMNEREAGGEPVADLRVRHMPLHGIEIPAEQIPLAIDEFPVLFVAAACADGETLLRGAEELRVKESDRIAAMADGLKTLGIEVETFADGLRVRGGVLGGGDIDSHGDHRIAMAFAVAGLRASAPVRIHNCANVATSFPGFLELAQSVGLRISSEAG